MMFMTAKVDLKKILLALGIVAGIIAGALWLLGGSEDVSTAAPSVATNEGRVEFLKGFGWEVVTSPVESGQVRIPQEQSPIFARYNELQKSQGYDLDQYAGQAVMRYVYKVENYPGATAPVYATLLVYKDKIVGGDVTDTSAKGKVLPLQRQDIPVPETTTPSTAPTM